MQIHLVDATYELFRAHYSPRPATLAPDGRDVGAVVGLLYSMLALLRDEGATHVGCATDHVIRSFRNDLYAGYKTDAGVPRELLAQFPLAERAMAAMGLAVWPMVEFEADDALAAAADRWAEAPGVDRIVDLHTGQGPGPVRPRRPCRDRVTGAAPSPTTRPAWRLAGECGRPRSPTTSHSSAIPPTASRDCRAGAPSPRRPSSRSSGSIEAIPANPGEWHVNVRSAGALAAALREGRDDALLFRVLATLRTDAPLPQRDVAELEWRGARRAEFTALCDELGQPRLAERPHLWQD